jgi:hypothetical protein
VGRQPAMWFFLTDLIREIFGATACSRVLRHGYSTIINTPCWASKQRLLGHLDLTRQTFTSWRFFLRWPRLCCFHVPGFRLAGNRDDLPNKVRGVIKKCAKAMTETARISSSTDRNS